MTVLRCLRNGLIVKGLETVVNFTYCTFNRRTAPLIQIYEKPCFDFDPANDVFVHSTFSRGVSVASNVIPFLTRSRADEQILHPSVALFSFRALFSVHSLISVSLDRRVGSALPRADCTFNVHDVLLFSSFLFFLIKAGRTVPRGFP